LHARRAIIKNKYAPKVKYQEGWTPQKENNLDLWEHVESVGTKKISAPKFDNNLEISEPISVFKAPEKKIKNTSHLSSDIATRSVKCFRCDHVHQAPEKAEAANCPKCGLYISLLDHKIKHKKNEAIETRGDVEITNSGSMSGVSIKCHNLVIKGSFTGSVDCTGIFEVFSPITLKGHFKIKKLIIHPTGKVSSTIDIHAQEIECAGQLDAENYRVIASESLTISNKGHAKATLEAKSFKIEAGAFFGGQVNHYKESVPE